jgi:hypothetical protein
MQASEKGGPESPFSGDQLVLTFRRGPNDEGLDHAVNPNGICQLLEGIFVEVASRLARVWVNASNGEGRHGGFRRAFSQQMGKAFS